MKTKFWLSFLTLTSFFAITQIAQAQTYQPTNRTPVADQTLGTQVLGNGSNFDITGGLSKGQTLFHSFTDFSVPTSGQANFLNPVGNRDIITRVTGNLFSDINGLVNTNGANFFLINPSGIVFGPSATLNVGKAFVGSTANSLDLVGGGQTIRFGTNPSGDAPLLSVAPNVLFDVSRLNLGGGAGAISNFGTLQTTNPNQYIGLIGGNVDMSGGQIIVPGGRVELGGLSVAGAVGLNTEGNNLRAQFPTNVGRGDVVLTDKAQINVTGTGDGDIAITARNISLLTGSFARGGIDTGVSTPESVAGDIKLNATEKVAIIGSGSVISNNVNANATGQGGNLTIDAGSVLVQDDAVIGTATGGQGDAGNVNIRMTGDLTIDGNNKITGISSSTDGRGDAGKITIDTQGNILLANSGLIFATITPDANGNSQGISITAKNLNLSNNSAISSNSFGDKGNAGDITIKVAGAIDLASSEIASGVDIGITGNGGNIAIDTGSISLKDSALRASTSRTGNAGNITVTAKDAISLVNGKIFSTVNAGGLGKGGNIDLNAGSISIKDRALLVTSTLGASATQPAGRGDAGNISIKTTGDLTVDGNNKIAGISSSSAGQGNAGKITIDAQGNILLANSGAIFAAIAKGASGNGQDISITANNLKLLDSFISSDSFGDKGNAGDITIKVSGAVDIAGTKKLVSGISSAANTGTVGNSGNITINADSIYLRDGGSLSTSTFGEGSAGNILLNSGKVLLNKGNILSTSASTTGGNITLKNTDYLIVRNNSFITTNSDSTAKNGNGGNITISSPVIAATPGNNDITANANQGAGGQVKITSQGLFGIQYRPKGQASDFANDITASSTFGRDGAVNISTPGTDPGTDNTELPKTPTDASNQISQVCGVNSRQNKLTVTGRGGLPPNANDPLTGDVVWQDARAALAQLESPAIGWVKDPLTGNVVWQNPHAASNQSAPSNATTNPVKIIPPAVGWVLDGKGKVTLIAAATEGQPTGTRVACPKTK